jgi:hypothetical protein
VWLVSAALRALGSLLAPKSRRQIIDRGIPVEA